MEPNVPAPHAVKQITAKPNGLEHHHSFPYSQKSLWVMNISKRTPEWIWLNVSYVNCIRMVIGARITRGLIQLGITLSAHILRDFPSGGST